MNKPLHKIADIGLVPVGVIEPLYDFKLSEELFLCGMVDVAFTLRMMKLLDTPRLILKSFLIK